jgi:cell wall-associated NlpC family hydrolase
MKHWSTKYIGIPWKFGGDSFNGFDCWNFFRHVQKAEFSIKIPVLGNKWTELDSPKDGDAVLLSQFRDPAHIGIYVKIPGNQGSIGVLHCVEPQGVIFSSAENLKELDWKIIKYYEFNEK